MNRSRRAYRQLDSIAGGSRSADSARGFAGRGELRRQVAHHRLVRERARRPGYSFRFVSEVKDGKLRGLHGTEGEPSSLLIEGKIEADGTARLYATGRTGSKEYVPGRDTPRGTEYSYSIDARFKGTEGTGKRVEGRPCSFQFEKH